MKFYNKPGLPEEIFGVGASKQIGARMKNFDIHSCLVVTDAGIVKAGLVEPILEDIRNHGIEYEVWDKCLPNSPDYICMELGEHIKNSKFDAVLAIGGGSPMDTAKAGCAISMIPGKIEDLHDYCTSGGGEGFVSKMKNNYRRNFTLITVATTHATGSEATKSGVITDTKRNLKYSILNPYTGADLCITDPALTLGMPRLPTAATGMDAMSHPLEQLLAADVNDFNMPIYLDAVRRVWQWLPVACEEPDNVEARSNLCFAAIQGNSNGGFCPGHAISNALGGMYHVAHGHLCALVLPAEIRHFADFAEDRIKKVAEIMGVPTSEDNATIANRVAAALVKFYKGLGLTNMQDTLRANGFDIDKKTFIDTMAPPILLDNKTKLWEPPIHRDEDRDALIGLLGEIYEEQ